MSDLRISPQPVLRPQSTQSSHASHKSHVEDTHARVCKPTNGRTVDATTYAALQTTDLARHIDPNAENVSHVTRRHGDTYLREMRSDNIRIREVRYPDGSGFLHVDRTHAERTVPGFINTKIRTYDSETVRMHPDGKTSVIASEAFGSEREMMLFENERLGIRIGWREQSSAQASAEFEGGVESSALLRGRAGVVFEARNRKLGVYTQGSLGINNSAQSVTYHDRDGRGALAFPGLPISGDSKEIGNQRQTDVGVSFGSYATLGVGTEVETDFEALPLVEAGEPCHPEAKSPAHLEQGTVPEEPRPSALDDVERRLGISGQSRGESVTLDDIERRLQAMERKEPSGMEWSEFDDGQPDDQGFVEFE